MSSNQFVTCSIALCTYNSEKFLKSQLQSIKDQKLLPNEMVVCDDGSTDASIFILQEFKKESPFPVKIICNEKNLGYTKNFEKAISFCSCDIIFLCDHDDIWLPEKIVKMKEAFIEQPQIDLFFCDSYLVDQNLNNLGTTFLKRIHFSEAEQKEFTEGGNPLSTLLYRTVPSGNTMAFRKSLLPKILPISTYWVHDSWTMNIAAMVGKIGFINEPLVLYRQHENQNIGVINGNFMNRLLQRMQKTFAGSLKQNYKLAMANKDLQLRAEEFVNAGISLDFNTISFLQQKSEHFMRRSKFPQNSILRVPFIVKELLCGNYHKYENGFVSALKDLFLSAASDR